MRVVEIVRYPVKSMGGERLAAVEVGELGLVGDRGWGVRDLATGTTLTGRRAPDLLFAAARVVDGEVVVTLPDGVEVGEGDDGALSSWLGRDVALVAADGEAAPVFENPLDAENEADWVRWDGPTDSFHDSPRRRVSLVTTTSLNGWDHRRFRTNVIVDGAGEDAFVGGRLTVGSTVLDVVKRIDRCVMVTRAQPGLERDLDVLRRINAERDRSLSIGCTVAVPGEIALGSKVVPG